MSVDRKLCEQMEVRATDLARGEIDPRDEAALRAHLDSCLPCRGFAADAARVLGALAAREVPAAGDPAGDRERLWAGIDAALDEAPEGVPDRPRLRLLERMGNRYAESRAVRFLTFSAGLHAAAAVLLALWLGFSPDSPFRRPSPPSIEVGDAGLVLDPADPLRPPPAGAPNRTLGGTPGDPWPVPFPSHPDAERASLPAEDPIHDLGNRSLYPNEEFRQSAVGRFRRDQREARLAECFGPVEGPRTALAVERGLRWLTADQRPDGTWASAEPIRPAAERDAFSVGVTGVAVQAFLGNGSTALRPGPHQGAVRSALNALASSQDAATGLLGRGAPGWGAERPLVNHGPALAALAEAYGLDYGYLDAAGRASLRRVVEAGVRYSLGAQREDGSFGYRPGAERGELTVTLLQVEALDAARRAGFAVDPAALRRAAAFVRAHIGEDGRVGHGEPGDRPRDATLTAEVLGLAGALGLDGEIRARMVAAVASEAREGGFEGRILFRTALLEALVAAGDGERLATDGPFAARATLDTQLASGAFATGGDPLATARAVRALTAPYRTAGL